MTHTFLVDENGEFHRVEDPPKIADMVCVVRCKDCRKRYNSLFCPVALIADILKSTGVFKYNVDDDWFCADGVKKDA